MALNFLLLCLAIAAVINVWFTGTLFDDLRRRFITGANHRYWLVRWISRGILCHFCFSCWFAIGFSIWDKSLVGIATILPVNLILFLFTLITQKVPMWVDMKLEVERRKLKADRKDTVN